MTWSVAIAATGGGKAALAATTAAWQLKTERSDTHVTVFAGAGAPLLVGNPYIDEVVAVANWLGRREELRRRARSPRTNLARLPACGLHPGAPPAS